MASEVSKQKIEGWVNFIGTYGPLVYKGTDDELRRVLRWYYAHDQLLVIAEEGKTIAIVAGHIMKTPHDWILSHKFPEDDFTGKYLYIPFIVIHPLFQNSQLLSSMLIKVLSKFPQIEYITFNRVDRGGRPFVKRVEDLLPQEDRNGGRHSASSTITATA